MMAIEPHPELECEGGGGGRNIQSGGDMYVQRVETVMYCTELYCVLPCPIMTCEKRARETEEIDMITSNPREKYTGQDAEARCRDC